MRQVCVTTPFDENVVIGKDEDFARQAWALYTLIRWEKAGLELELKAAIARIDELERR